MSEAKGRETRRLALRRELLGVVERLDPHLRASGRAVRVLVVDDSRAWRALATSILAEAGYEVRAVADGSLAWALLQDAPFDVVVSDLQMPQMDGLGLVAKLRGSCRLADIPVILNSAQSEDPSARSAALAAGANDYIAKGGSAARTRLLASVARWVPRGGR